MFFVVAQVTRSLTPLPPPPIDDTIGRRLLRRLRLPQILSLFFVFLACSI